MQVEKLVLMKAEPMAVRRENLMVEMLVVETGDLLVVRTELQLAEELVDMLAVLMMQLQVVMMVDYLE